MKNYVGISRDHSGSMSHLRSVAMRDYNSNIESIKAEAQKHDIDTIVSVVKCGVRDKSVYRHGGRAIVEREIVNSNVSSLKPIKEYTTDGNSTPLFDSVGDLIEMFENVPDYDNLDVSFLIMVITDGEENSSQRWNGRTIAAKIKQLQKTDRWTFVFRVPKGGRRELTQFGIPDGNILEWEQTERGFEEATQRTNVGVSNYYSCRATGARSVDKFYTDLTDVDIKQVKTNLVDISKEVQAFKVKTADHGIQIRDYVENKVKQSYIRGSVFYQLTKTEKVQDYKQIIIKDRIKGHVYSGNAARDLLGLPRTGEIKLIPGSHGQYDVFIQSTSVNRKLVADTEVLIWKNA